MKSLLIPLLCLMSGATPGQQQPPPLHGDTLDGKPITLPDASAGKVTLLLVAFSRKGGDNTAAWRDRFEHDFGSNPRVTSYAVAMLQDAPSLLRGMIKAGMRSGTPPARRSHFVVCTSNEQAWKQFTGMSDDKWPFLVLLDGSGHVRWTHGGLFAESQYAALKAAVAEALNR